MDVEYELAQQLQGHDGNVRSLALLPDGTFVTGGSKGDVIQWKRTGPKETFELAKKVKHHTGSVFALAACSGGGYFSGSQDKTAVRVDAGGNHATHFAGHAGPVCSLAERGEQLVTGSWDGTAKVWNSSTGALQQTLQVGKNAVVVAVAPGGELITGSQEGSLCVWKGSECVHKVATAHTEKINAIHVTSVGMLTGSHDCNVKMWSFDGCEMASWCGHNNFVYHVTATPDDRLTFSTSDDCTLKVWSNEDFSCKQSIVHSAAVWQAVCLSNMDVVTACSDATIRIWSTDPARHAAADVREAQRTDAVQAMFNPLKNGSCSVPTEQSFQEIVDVDMMSSLEGRVGGEIKCFKEGQTIVGCHWDHKGHCWKRDASYEHTAEQQAAERQYYIGDNYFPFGQYDWIFNVDMSEAGQPAGETKALPFNKDQNPMEIAEKFCNREGINRSYADQVRQFIIQNSGGVGANAPASGSSAASPPEPESTIFPVMEFSSFKDGKFDAIKAKVLELNEQVGDELKMEPLDLQYFGDAIEKLKKGVVSELRPCEKQVIMDKLKEWPQDKIFPVIDLWRLFLVHPASSDFFKGSDRGAPYVLKILNLFGAQPSGPLGLCCARFLANMFIFQTNRYAIFDRRDLILPALKTPLATGSKHVKVACATVLLNIANVLHESSTPPKTWDSATAVTIAQLALAACDEAGPDDGDAVKRAALAIGTLLPRDRKNGGPVAQRCLDAGFVGKLAGFESIIGAPVAADLRKLLQ